ncbi:MAG: T9SS type A sorting domain-containing protein [Bacteroidota bacterium]
MKKSLLILILFSSASLFAQGIRNTGAKIVIQASTYLYDDGNYLNESTGANHGTIDSDGSIYITGNWTNNATDVANKVFTGLDATGVVRFTGATTPQTIAGTRPTNFENLTVLKSAAAQVVLVSNSELNGLTTVGGAVAGVLTMTTGIMQTNANTVDLGASGSIVETPITATSYVLGNLKATRNIGLGVPQIFGSMGVVITSACAANSTVVTRVTGTQLTGNIPCCAANLSIRRYFDIVPTVNAGLNASLTFNYFDWEIVGFTEANLWLTKAPLPYVPGNPMWVGQNSAVIVANNQLTEAAIPSFSRWTANADNVPLPINLLGFDGKCGDEGTLIAWSTLTETNNDYFTLEKSNDLINWTVAATVEGAGNSNSLISYSAIDRSPSNGMTDYYRLRQTDFDGVYTLTEAISVNCMESIENNNIVNIFQNENKLEINLFDTEKLAYSIELYDATARRLVTTKHIPESSGYHHVEIDISGLAVGCYVVVLQTQKGLETQKVVIQNH